MTIIRLHDSMTRAKREFVPLDPTNVRLYLCGPTVYDRAHIGNARAAVVGDVLFRLLRHVYGADHVTYVRNITDIDDKIMARAQETGRPIDAITAETAQWYQDDMAAIGCLAPTHEPRATGHVAGMVAMIETLIARGNAYAAEGHVLFAVDSFPDYGRLSGRSVDDMIAGARVEVAPYKKNPMDFVLWKPSAPGQPGWESPWGRGRPGWHIECSAMSSTLLGPDFDIHAGGSDLLFPHHENEIAQSRCAEPAHGFARYWVHNGMVQVDGRKMSKSEGNFVDLSELFVGVDSPNRSVVLRPTEPVSVRVFLLKSHYRAPINLTEDRLMEARILVNKWEKLLESRSTATRPYALEQQRPDQRLVDALADDLNTPQAFQIISDLEAKANSISNEGNNSLAVLHHSLLLLGIDAVSSTHKRSIGDDLNKAWIEIKIRNLLMARAEARKAKDFARADAIRKGLDAAGVVVMDRTGGPTEWELGPNFDPSRLAAIDA